MNARAKEAGGQGNADAKVSMQLTGTGDDTEVALHSQINVTGKAAQMGEGVMVAVTEGMIKEFSDNLAKPDLPGPLERPRPVQYSRDMAVPLALRQRNADRR